MAQHEEEEEEDRDDVVDPIKSDNDDDDDGVVEAAELVDAVCCDQCSASLVHEYPLMFDLVISNITGSKHIQEYAHSSFIIYSLIFWLYWWCL